MLTCGSFECLVSRSSRIMSPCGCGQEGILLIKKQRGSPEEWTKAQGSLMLLVIVSVAGLAARRTT